MEPFFFLSRRSTVMELAGGALAMFSSLFQVMLRGSSSRASTTGPRARRRGVDLSVPNG